jgi:hypothetical protein
MKKILMAAVALICMTMTCAVFTSCGDDKNDTKTVVYYKYTGVDNMTCLQTTEGLLQYTEFATALGNVLSSIQSREVTDQDVVNMTQSVVDSYDNKMIDGTFKLERSYNASDWTTLKTFKVNANEKYKNN